MSIVVLLITESESVIDIVYEETGFDMRYIDKADLHRDMTDATTSVKAFTPESEEVSELDLVFFFNIKYIKKKKQICKIYITTHCY